jgi:hypothetical protein
LPSQRQGRGGFIEDEADALVCALSRAIAKFEIAIERMDMVHSG